MKQLSKKVKMLKKLAREYELVNKHDICQFTCEKCPDVVVNRCYDRFIR